MIGFFRSIENHDDAENISPGSQPVSVFFSKCFQCLLCKSRQLLPGQEFTSTTGDEEVLSLQEFYDVYLDFFGK